MRTSNSIKNIIFGIGGQIFTTLISFISRTIFIYILGADYLGVNGLFSNILSMLSLAELGVGSAIIYNMYKPIADKDTEKIKSLMNLYKKAYMYIGIFIAVVGVIITPFLDVIIKDTPNIPNLTLIYLMFLANSVVSYFYIYKSSMITADQKNYIIVLKQQKFTLIQTILQTIILIISKNYILYLSIQIICTFSLNLSISKKANEIYPFLKEKKIEELSSNDKKTIFKHVTAMMSHKVGGVVVNGTDNILISSFVGVFWVGLYSNYVLIINMVNRFVGQVFTAITASVGNLNAEESKEKSYDVFKKIFFANFWLYGFCSTCLLCLLNPFINIWIGKKFLLSNIVVLIIIINFYLMGMRQTTAIFNSTLGLFWNDRYKPWFEALINIVASIVLLRKFGLVGVFLGTFISTISTSLWVEPYILFKHGFNKKLYKYFYKYLIYTLITIFSCIITNYLCSLVKINYLFINFIIKFFICLIVPNVIFVLFTFRMSEFKHFYNLIYNIRLMYRRHY